MEDLNDLMVVAVVCSFKVFPYSLFFLQKCEYTAQAKKKSLAHALIFCWTVPHTFTLRLLQQASAKFTRFNFNQFLLDLKKYITTNSHQKVWTKVPHLEDTDYFISYTRLADFCFEHFLKFISLLY